MSNIDAEELRQFNIELEKDLRRLHSKIPPPNKISETDIYIRNVFSHVYYQGETLIYLSYLYQGPSKRPMEGL